MSAKTVIEELFVVLQRFGVVGSRSEFYNDWLNRSESYLRVLQHNNKSPSTKTLAICSSKLRYYANLLKSKDDEKSIEVALEFDRIGNRIDDLIFEQSKSEWTQKMILDSRSEDRIGVL